MKYERSLDVGRSTLSRPVRTIRHRRLLVCPTAMAGGRSFPVGPGV